MDIEDTDKTFGFGRPELCPCNQEELSGSLNLDFECHVLVSTKVHYNDWAEKSGNVPGLVGSDKAKTPRNKINCFYAPDLDEGTTWVFSSASPTSGESTELSVKQYLSVDHYVEHKESGVLIPSIKTFVFVCAHALRDKRCGHCGPILIDALETEIMVQKISKQNNVRVFAVNHVGGHKYAGNVLLYTRERALWYGYVCPRDVAPIVASMACLGSSVPPMPTKVRGVLGLSDKGQKEVVAKWRAADDAARRQMWPSCKNHKYLHLLLWVGVASYVLLNRNK